MPARTRSPLRSAFLRDFHAAGHLETFLVAAVSAVLVTRLFLHLLGYPRIEGDVLHIAHLLWGGVGMLAAFVFALSFRGRAADRLAAALGGLGFGLFVDEVGKFVTRDHDYFYQPAVALIYVAFVAIFLARHAVRAGRAYTPTEYLVNALGETEELALRDMDPGERRRALEWLDRADPDHPLVPALRAALTDVPLVEAPGPSPFARAKAAARRLYRRVARLPGFDTALVLFFVGQLVVKLAWGALLIFVVGLGWERVFDVAFVGASIRRMASLSGLEIAGLVASAVSGGFLAVGVAELRASRLAAYRWFERAILASILLVQPFSFYREQFAALVELAFNLSVLAALRTMVALEEERSGPAGEGPATA